jgi:hypothetical protein
MRSLNSGPPRIYLDEDVDVLLEALLRARGFDVVHTVAESQVGNSDDAQLRYATDNGRAILTHNRIHFEVLATEWFGNAESHAGIIVASRRPIHELAQRALWLLSTVRAEQLQNQIRYI